MAGKPRLDWLPTTGLEHSQAKWKPVRHPEMRQNNKIERFHDSS
jgi:hypothetical protein